MSLSWKNWKLKDIVYGIVVPTIVVLIIFAISIMPTFLGRTSFGIFIGIAYGLSEAVLIVAVPMLLGLIWNQWAGGASGFLLGSIYALWYSDKFIAASIFRSSSQQASLRVLFGDPSLLGYVLSAMLIGYVSGALNRRSENFMRMVISGILSGTIGGILMFFTCQFSNPPLIYGIYGFLITLLPRVACGVLIPIIAKVFTWYGATLGKPKSEYSPL
jgi:hypothetical protein